MSSSPEFDVTFENWGKTLSVRPRNYFKPQNEDEVIEVVRRVAAAGEQLRVVGAGHSWAPLVIDNDNMMSLDSMSEIVAVDDAQHRVTVQAGMRLSKLNVLLAERGLALTNLGSISAQTVAGAISTGTHGTGLKLGNISTQVVGLTLITADGQRRVLRADADAELLSAARVSLGALGVITEVTLQCEPAYDLDMQAWPMPFEEALDNLDSLLATNERVRLYWFANTDVIQVCVFNRTTKPRSDVNQVAEYFREVLFKTDFLWLLQETGYVFPGLVAPINRFAARIGWTREERVDRSDKVLTIAMPPRHDETEYAIPVADTAGAMRKLRGLIDEANYKVNLPIEVRFVAADDNMLSPCHGRATAYIGAYTFGEKFSLPLFSGFEPLMKSFGGRPHWGKTHSLTAEEARGMYAWLPRFVEIRRQLDPAGVFLNPYLAALFAAAE